MINKMLKSKLAQNGIWMLILKVFNTIVPMLTIPYITRILSQAAYGEYAIAANWISYFQVVVEYGFALSGAKKTAVRKSDKELEDIRGAIVCSRLLLFVMCLIPACIILIAVPSNIIRKICFAILFTSVFSLVFQHNWFFQGIEELKTVSIINIIGKGTSAVLTFALVKNTNDIYLYCIITALGSVLTSVISSYIVSNKYSVRLKVKRIHEIVTELKDGWALFVSTATSTVFTSVGVTILSMIGTSADVGAYSAVNKISYVLLMLFSAIGQAIYPRSCQSFIEGFRSGVKSIKKMLIPVMSVFMILGIAIILFNKTIVGFAFGKEYVSYAYLVYPFVVWSLLGMLNNFLGIQILVASGHQHQYSKAFIISTALMIILMFVLGYKLKALGIAMASMCSELVLSIILSFFIGKIIRGHMN